MNSASLQNAHWMGRLFVAVQIAICFVLGLGEFGRIVSVAIICLSIFLGHHFRLSKSFHTVLLVVGGAFFGILAISRIFGDSKAGLLELFEMLAEYLLIVQALELLRKRSLDLSTYRVTNYLPGLGTLVVIMLVVSREVPLSLQSLTALFTTFPVLLAMVMRPDFISLALGNRSQRRKAIALACIVVVGLASGSLFRGEVTRQLPLLQSVLRTIQPPIDDSQRLTVRSRAQFVRRVDLTSISLAQRTNPDELVFRAESVSPPGYMRTLSFEQFDGVNWKNSWTNDRRSTITKAMRIAPMDHAPNGIGFDRIPMGTKLFPFPNGRNQSVTQISVSVPSDRGLLVPLPLNTTYLLATTSGRNLQLVLDLHGNVWPNVIENNSYQAFAGSEMDWPIDDDYADRLLQLPTEDAEFIKLLAANVCGEAGDTQSKLNAIEKYFTDNFEYSFEPEAIGLLKGRSPIRAFLENRRAGHCELFATASVLLLRAQGVPCRLSSGYLVYEMDDDRDYYYARNRDAHAWAEAYDRESGNWQLVESTPGIRAYVARLQQDQPEAALAAEAGRATENLFPFVLSEFFESLQRWWVQLLASRFSWLIPLLIGGFVVSWRFARARNSSNRDFNLVSQPVRRADRRASRLGLKREPSETCLQFARRLADSGVPDLVAMSDWYVKYSQKRYVHKGATK